MKRLRVFRGGGQNMEDKKAHSCFCKNCVPAPACVKKQYEKVIEQKNSLYQENLIKAKTIELICIHIKNLSGWNINLEGFEKLAKEALGVKQA